MFQGIDIFSFSWTVFAMCVTHKLDKICNIGISGFSSVWKPKKIGNKKLLPVSIETILVWCLSNWANVACVSYEIFKLSLVHRILDSRSMII